MKSPDETQGVHQINPPTAPEHTRKHYWIYAEGVDEAGTVVEGETLEAAYTEAKARGFDPHGAEVWAYELGLLHSLGSRD